MRLALQDFRLNPCTSRDGPLHSCDAATSKPSEQEAKLPGAKGKGQKAIADFFKRSGSAQQQHDGFVFGARSEEGGLAAHRNPGVLISTSSRVRRSSWRACIDRS